VHRLSFISHARDLGFPINEIEELLSLWSDRSRASADVKALALARAEELGRKARALEAMRASLLDLASRCRGDSRPECPIIDRLQAV
jgi:DNA-binding transcriptional MerR regulator